MKKCFKKEFAFIVPKLICGFCNKYINPGQNLYTIILSWGNSKSACKNCFNLFEGENDDK